MPTRDLGWEKLQKERALSRSKLRARLEMLQTAHPGGLLDIYDALMACGRNYAEQIENVLFGVLDQPSGVLAGTFMSELVKYKLPTPLYALKKKPKKGEDPYEQKLPQWDQLAATWEFPSDPEPEKEQKG